MPLTSGLVGTPIVDGRGLLTPRWQIQFRDQVVTVNDVAVRKAVVQPTPVAVALPSTPIGTGPLPSGLYRVSAAVHITAPVAGSSVAVTLHWKDGAPPVVPCSLLLVPPVVGDTTTSAGTGTATIHIGADTEISYSTTYTPAGSGMQYALHVVLETMGGA